MTENKAGQGPMAEPNKITEQAGAGVPVASAPVGAMSGAPAEYPRKEITGMFGVKGSGDTSGFGGLARRRPNMADTPRPFGGYFDEVYDALEEAYPGFGDAVERVIVYRGELTLFVKAERIREICQIMRDDEALRFELCSSVSGVDYLGSDERRLHVVYHLTSMTYRRRVRPPKPDVSPEPAEPNMPRPAGLPGGYSAGAPLIAPTGVAAAGTPAPACSVILLGSAIGPWPPSLRLGSSPVGWVCLGSVT